MVHTATALRTEFINRAHSNVDYFWSTYVNQANNSFGLILPGEQYSGSISRIAIWQQDMVTAAWGYSRALGLPLDATRTSRLAAFFNWKAQSIVGRLGTASTFPVENANRYTIELGVTLAQSGYKLGTGPWPASWAGLPPWGQALAQAMASDWDQRYNQGLGSLENNCHHLPR